MLNKEKWLSLLEREKKKKRATFKKPFLYRKKMQEQTAVNLTWMRWERTQSWAVINDAAGEIKMKKVLPLFLPAGVAETVL